MIPFDSILIGCLAAPEAAKSDGEPEEVANLRQALVGKRDITVRSVGKVDMGETFLGTNMGDVAERHFFLHPVAFFVFIFTLGELFFFRCLGRGVLDVWVGA